MSRASVPLLTRLRRYRGLWLLAFATLMIKLLSSSVCLGDGNVEPFTASQGTTTQTLATVSGGSDAALDDACLLGEAGNCHCACTHALTLASQMVSPIAPMVVTMESPRLSLGLMPDTTGSVLRPPIA